MSYKIVLTDDFKTEFKKLLKKFSSLKLEIEELGKSLELNPIQGISIGKNCFKIRLAIRSKNTGKSGGVRVITHIKIIKQTVYLLSIYDKSEQPSIGDKEVTERIKGIK